MQFESLWIASPSRPILFPGRPERRCTCYLMRSCLSMKSLVVMDSQSPSLRTETAYVSRFWKTLHESMGTKLQFSMAYHPQTDGQLERTIQTLEDML